MLKRIPVLEDGSFQTKETRSWRIEGQKRRITRKECQRLSNKFEMEDFMVQKGFRNLVREKVLQDGRELPKEEGDVIREYWAMHEDLSSWLREDGKEKEEKTMEKATRPKKRGAKWQWYEFVEKWAHRERLWKMMEKEQCIRFVGILLL